jgi:hypothetical protein
MSCKFSLSGQQQVSESLEQGATREAQAQLGRFAQSIGEKALAELQSKIERGEPLGLTVDEIVSLVTAGVELERSALEDDPPDSSIETF